MQRPVSLPARAGIAQLVEHDLAKVGVASSSLVSRSRFSRPRPCRGLLFRAAHGGSGWNGTRMRGEPFRGHRPGGRVVMQRTANPRTPVRFRPWPPILKPLMRHVLASNEAVGWNRTRSSGRVPRPRAVGFPPPFFARARVCAGSALAVFFAVAGASVQAGSVDVLDASHAHCGFLRLGDVSLVVHGPGQGGCAVVERHIDIGGGDAM